VIRRTSFLLLVTCIAAGAAAACSSSKGNAVAPTGGDADAGADGGSSGPETYPTTELSAEPQRAGDPQKGYHALVNNAYVPCGIPWSAYSQVFPAAAPADQLPGRDGRNATVAYSFTAFTTPGGVDLVGSNCLTCHAGHINGQLVVGLGAADSDFTQDMGSGADLVGMLLSDPKEIAEYQKWKERVDVVAPYSVLSTKGPNPADEFTAALFAHHDPKTLAWSATPLMTLPPIVEVPVDVPPWWRMKKKTAMFYTGAGRGDHARIMMTASVLCTSSVTESQAIDAYFPDVKAYIESITPPAFPFSIDRDLAAKGQPVFEQHCSGCHGTYGANGTSGTYATRVVGLDVIGTDALLASGTAEFAAPMIEWYKESFFGQLARFEPNDGYVAPPLDGIWATAPYLHNGSIPTIAALLDSTTRPQYWTRSFDSKDYDAAALGWKFVTLNHGKDAEPSASTKKVIYDTTKPGYSNTGHTFGDALTSDERAAVIEYLKTL
jgi:cytochrome c5